MSLHRATVYDPRGLIAESYHIEGISSDEAKSIFLDWAMQDLVVAPEIALGQLIELYGDRFPDHPMTVLLQEGMKPSPTRPSSRRRRLHD